MRFNNRYKSFRGSLLQFSGLTLWVLLSSPATFAADTFNGKKIYQTYCEGCHGKTGRGEMPGTPNFSRGQGLIRTDLSLLNHIRSGRNAMPAFEGILDNNEILDVISYIRTLY